MEWTVRIETASPDDVLSVGDKSAYDRLRGLLADFAPAGGISDSGWDLEVTVQAGDIDSALAMGKALILRAAADAGVPLWEVVALSAVATELQWIRNSAFVAPDIVGVHEVLGMLNVSKQRLGELRRDGRFPKPIAELGATPVWRSSTIQGFMATWERSPGRFRPWPLNMLRHADEISLIRAVPDVDHPNVYMIGIWLDEDHHAPPKAMHTGPIDGARRLAMALNFIEVRAISTREFRWEPKCHDQVELEAQSLGFA